MHDFNTILEAHFGALTDRQLLTVQSFFKIETLKRNEYFTKAGRICDRLSLVRSGILRVYATYNDKEITQWLSTKGYFVTDLRGFLFNQPNRWSIQAFADTELLTITKQDYQRLCRDFPEWNEIEKRFVLKCFTIIEDRVFSHLSMTAEERYLYYFDQNPELFNQVPLHYIASVLGMTPETFSRIRKRYAAKS